MVAALSVGINIGTSPPVGLSRIMARTAGWMGADVLWLVDHYTGWFPQELWTPDFTWLARRGGNQDAYFDWQVMAGYHAARLPGRRLGVGVTEPLRRHPVTLAQAALTLSHLSRRPFILGIGAGEAENTVPYGVDFERPVARLEEALQVIRLCFESLGPVDFDGRFFKLDRAILDVAPGRGGQPEIWVAAHGRRMLRLTGLYGDGWYPTLPMTPDEYRESLDSVRAVATEQGRDGDGITAAMQAFYLAAPDRSTAERWLTHRAIRFLALLAPDAMWQKAGVRHPLGEGFRGLVDFVPSHHQPSAIEAAIEAVPAEVLAGYLLWGTPDDVVDRLRTLGDAGLEHVSLAPVAPLVSRRALLFTLRTLPQITGRLRQPA